MGNPSAPTSPLLLTLDVVAERLSVTRRSVQNWVRRGDLPVVRIGRLIRVDADELKRFLDSHRA